MPLAEPQIVPPLDFETGFDAGIIALVFSDAGLLAAALGDGSLRLVEEDRAVRTVQVHRRRALPGARY
jgi:hypothetical protein